MRPLSIVALLATLLMPAAARAQDAAAYVAGSLGADIARTGSVDENVSAGNGEALSFSLRVGAAIVPRFGVELDFTRPEPIEVDETPDVRILATSGLVQIYPPIASIIGWKVHTAQRNTTVTAAAWVRQDITPRVSMVYLGGLVFARVSRSIRSSFDFVPVAASIYRPTYETKTVDYGRGPMGGLEARINLTDHAQLVPGVRLLAIEDAWIMRPAIALGWSF